MMPPLPAFLSNLQRQNPAAPGSYGTITTTNSALAGSPAQYLQSRQPHQNMPGGHSPFKTALSNTAGVCTPLSIDLILWLSQPLPFRGADVVILQGQSKLGHALVQCQNAIVHGMMWTCAPEGIKTYSYTTLRATIALCRPTARCASH